MTKKKQESVSTVREKKADITVREIVKTKRTKNNLSQRDMALELGVSQATICKLENGSMLPTFDMLKMLRQKFKVNINKIMDA